MRRIPRLRAQILLLPLLLAACAGNGGVRADAIADAAPVQAVGAAQPVLDTTDATAPATDAQAGAIAAAPADTGSEAMAPAAQTADGAQADVVAPTQAPTKAELDAAAIYGDQAYNPVADPDLPPPAQLPSSYDPWESWNRRVHAFNNAVDRSIAKPLAKAYVAAVPRPLRLGVSNFFHNLAQPVTMLNELLQGKPKRAAQSLGRFVLNSTLGLAGIFDPASNADIPYYDEDFGQTLGAWGWKRSRYVELPLFGPRTVRDAFGLVGDAPLSPTRRIDEDRLRVFLQGLQLVDVRTQLFAADSMREGAIDDYALVRDAWLQRRNYQIFGERKAPDESLPEYLREQDANPTVPADAMPLIPGSAVP